jgi:hypothetical protein
MLLALRRPAPRTGRPQPPGMRQGLSLPTVRLATPTVLGVPRGVVGLSPADLVAQGRPTWGAPCTCGRGLAQDADLRTCGKNRCAPLAWRLDTLMQHLTGGGEGTNLAWLCLVSGDHWIFGNDGQCLEIHVRHRPASDGGILLGLYEWAHYESDGRPGRYRPL